MTELAMDERDERAKWLKLAYETYGPSGLREMAAAIGLDRFESRNGPHNGSVQNEVSGLERLGGPSSFYRHDDQYASPNHRPRTTQLDGSPAVSLYFWEPVGKGESSFGHLSTGVGNTMYSWGPGGMTIEPRETYLYRNRFRGALERELNLRPEEKRSFEEVLRDYGTHHEYNFLSANCADPTEEALERLGHPMGYRLSPKDLQDGVVALGLTEPNEYTYRRDQPSVAKDNRSLVTRFWDAIPAPWSPLFDP